MAVAIFRACANGFWLDAKMRIAILDNVASVRDRSLLSVHLSAWAHAPCVDEEALARLSHILAMASTS